MVETDLSLRYVGNFAVALIDYDLTIDLQPIFSPVIGSFRPEAPKASYPQHGIGRGKQTACAPKQSASATTKYNKYLYIVIYIVKYLNQLSLLILKFFPPTPTPTLTPTLAPALTTTLALTLALAPAPAYFVSFYFCFYSA